MQGDQVLGAMVFEFFSPGIAQILKLAGCEFVLTLPKRRASAGAPA